MKETKMHMSGVVYVKDPRDIEAIKKLKEQLRDLNHYKKKATKSESFKKQKEWLIEKERNIQAATAVLNKQFNDLKRIKEYKLGSFIDQSYWHTDVISKARKYGKKS